MKVKNFLFGVTAGILGGVIVTAITARQSGTNLCTVAKSNAGAVKSAVKEFTSETSSVKDAVNTLVTVAKNNIPQIVNGAKNSVQQFQEDIAPSTNQLQQELGSLQQSIGEIEKSIADLQSFTKNQ